MKKELKIKRATFDAISIDATLRTPLFSKDDGFTLDSEGVLYIEPQDTSELPYLDNGSTTIKAQYLVKMAGLSKKIYKQICHKAK